MKMINRFAVLTFLSFITSANCEGSVIRTTEENVDRNKTTSVGSDGIAAKKIGPNLQFSLSSDESSGSKESGSDADDEEAYAANLRREWIECDDIPVDEILRSSQDNGQQVHEDNMN